jgi:hypothetical protein
MWDSGHGLRPEAPFQWLDDDIILFNGTVSNWKEIDERQALWQWNLKNGISRYPVPAYNLNSEFCVNDGELTLIPENDQDWRKKKIRLEALVGRNGKFRKIVMPESYFNHEIRPNGVIQNNRCQFIDSPAQLDGFYWKALRKGDGFLKFHRLDGKTHDLITGMTLNGTDTGKN